MYTVEYIFKNKRFTESIAGTDVEIRTRFLKEGKKILDMKKHVQLFAPKVTKIEVIATFTALSDMLKGQEKLDKALTAIIVSFKKDSAIIPILTDIRANICKGQQLSACLEPYKKIFGATPITMIQAGEGAGKLSETLITVAKHMRDIEEAKGDLLKKMISPLITLSIGIMGLMLSTMYIIPKITKSALYTIANKKGAGDPIAIIILKQLAWITPVALVLLVIATIFGIYYFKNNQAKAEKILLKTPLVKELIFYRSYYVAFYSLSNLLKVGVRTNEALDIVGKSQRLVTLRNEFSNAIKNIDNGLQFASAFKNINTIERTILETSQREDRVQENFTLIANRFYNLYMEKIKGIGPIMQGIVITFIVALVGLMFAGIMLPYFDVIKNLK
jgi:type II secretory pathway component PulF